MPESSLHQTTYLPRSLFDAEQEAYRQRVKAFLAAHVKPYYADWEKKGMLDPILWKQACEAGLLYLDIPEKYGGQGIDDFRYNVVMIEELRAAHVPGVTFETGTDVTVPYLIKYGSEQQQRAWLPRIAAGDVITAIGMSEPGGGSDLAGMQTTAERDGDQYVINGEKMWITNGFLCHLLVLACKTDPDSRHRGISLFLVDTQTEGFERKELLQKTGYHARDVARLAFHDMRLPASCRLGEEGEGFQMMMRQLPRERLGMAVNNIVMAELALDETLLWTRTRTTFGKPLLRHQHIRMKLAEMKTEIQIGRVFVDRCLQEYRAGSLDPQTAAMAKWWVSELQRRVLDQCVQLFGGRGYLQNNPVARMYVEGRVETIYGGTTEIMKEIIGKSLYDEVQVWPGSTTPPGTKRAPRTRP